MLIISPLHAAPFENKAIVLHKTTNEYFQYLFGPWDCSRTKLAKHHQNPLRYMYVIGPRRRNTRYVHSVDGLVAITAEPSTHTALQASLFGLDIGECGMEAYPEFTSSTWPLLI